MLLSGEDCSFLAAKTSRSPSELFDGSTALGHFTASPFPIDGLSLVATLWIPQSHRCSCMCRKGKKDGHNSPGLTPTACRFRREISLFVFLFRLHSRGNVFVFDFESPTSLFSRYRRTEHPGMTLPI